jgi:hypothetical protein
VASWDGDAKAAYDAAEAMAPGAAELTAMLGEIEGADESAAEYRHTENRNRSCSRSGRTTFGARTPRRRALRRLRPASRPLHASGRTPREPRAPRRAPGGGEPSAASQLQREPPLAGAAGRRLSCRRVNLVAATVPCGPVRPRCGR